MDCILKVLNAYSPKGRRKDNREVPLLYWEGTFITRTEHWGGLEESLAQSTVTVLHHRQESGRTLGPVSQVPWCLLLCRQAKHSLPLLLCFCILIVNVYPKHTSMPRQLATPPLDTIVRRLGIRTRNRYSPFLLLSGHFSVCLFLCPAQSCCCKWQHFSN